MSAVETYHRLTSSADAKEEYPDDPRLLQDFEPLRKDRFPAPSKTYPDGLPAVDLPVELPGHPVPAADVLSGRAPGGAAPLDLGEVARQPAPAGAVRGDGRHRRAAGRRLAPRPGGAPAGAGR
jgi:hypothetical protein